MAVNYRATTILKELAGDFWGNFINGRNTNRDDEGYAALWLETNPEDTVIMRDGSTRVVTP